jgi:hypothetical protein
MKIHVHYRKRIEGADRDTSIKPAGRLKIGPRSCEVATVAAAVCLANVEEE